MAIYSPDQIKAGEDLLAPEVNNPKQLLAYQRVLAALVAALSSPNGWVEIASNPDPENLRASARRIADSPIWGTFGAITRTGLNPSTGERVLQVRFDTDDLSLEELTSDDALRIIGKRIDDAKA